MHDHSELFRQLVTYLAPILPSLAKQTEELLNRPISSWADAQTPLTGTPVSPFTHFMKRIDAKQVEAMIEESKEAMAAEQGTAPAETPAVSEPVFHPADTWKDAVRRSGKRTACSRMHDRRLREGGPASGSSHRSKARRKREQVVQLTLSLGGGETRNVFAGIKAAYKPEDLVGRLVIMVANLKPRQMKFGLSTGMVCASGSGGPEVFLLSPDSGAVPGQRVH